MTKKIEAFFENLFTKKFEKRKAAPKLPGSRLSAYMDQLGVTVLELSACTGMEEAVLWDILNDKTPWNEVAPFDQFLLHSALFCQPWQVRDEHAATTQMKQFRDDFAFIREVYENACVNYPPLK